MAVPTSFDESNAVLDKPPNMTVDECEPLSILRSQTETGYPVVVSAWKLTAAELAEINETGRVWLVIYGDTMPPAMVEGVRPF